MLIRRAILGSAIALTAVFSTTACNFTSHVASLDYYAPSDGSQADVGRLKVRNLIYFTDNNGHTGFFGAFANSGSTEITFAIKYKNKTGQSEYREFNVGAYQLLNFGYQESKPLQLDLAGNPGDMVNVLVYTESDEASINVPIMDATLPQYTDLVAGLSSN
ncbi:MAG: hypothetical protein EBS85_04860 [Micrococcales bacterium]|nr:hypothetical protein [Actinomycetota bacterium]NCA08041.1 hypothetical protein [Micrococcales bacterium]